MPTETALRSGRHSRSEFRVIDGRILERLVLNIVNRHRDQPIEVEIQSQKGSFGGNFEVAEVNDPDIKAENTFGSKKVQASRKTITANGDPFKYLFPAHSYTMIKGALRQRGIR
jgi:alpha-N-arabinofuranosidase